jgi:hypothetical protein
LASAAARDRRDTALTLLSTPPRSLMLRSLIVAVLSLATASAAPVDCSKVQYDQNGYLIYQAAEVFPNPVQRTTVVLHELTKPYSLTLCGVTVTADASQYAFKTKDTKSLLTAMGSILGLEFNIRGYQRARGGSTYPQAAQLSIALPDGFMHTTVRITGYYAGQYLPADALMAVRINGGPLKPLLFNATFRSIEVDPKMDTLELFIKSSEPVIWEKMLLDVKNSQMAFFRKATFPSK